MCAAHSPLLDEPGLLYQLEVIDFGIFHAWMKEKRNGKSLMGAREMFHAYILSSCHGERGVVSGVSLATGLLSPPIRVLKNVDKRSEVSSVLGLNEDKHTLECSIESAKQMTGAFTEI